MKNLLEKLSLVICCIGLVSSILGLIIAILEKSIIGVTFTFSSGCFLIMMYTLTKKILKYEGEDE